MKLNTFLEHHGIQSNPFADEEAQTDPVFKDHCITTTHHPSWDKIFGNPQQPSTSIVFGEKGAGKTAMRLQIVKHIGDFNRTHPDEKVFVIEYDDFNPFLDRFRERLGVRADKCLPRFKLWDHMDAILILGVTRLVDAVLGVAPLPSGPKLHDEATPSYELPPEIFDRSNARDLLLLAACYDHSLRDTVQTRWQALRKTLRFKTWKTEIPRAIGAAVTLAILIVTFASGQWSSWLGYPYLYLLALAGWAPYLKSFLSRQWLSYGIVRNLRVGNRDTASLRGMLSRFTNDELAGQPLPNKQRTDDRYELLLKFQGLLKLWSFDGVIVLVDRIDEPDLVGGQADRMRSLLWPMLDNKFLKQPGFGVKVLAPVELAHYIEREDSAFYQRSRLDKQNLIRSLEWSGEALFDVGAARLQACAMTNKKVSLRDFFDDTISDRRLIDTFRSLRVPRHLFQFMYRLFVAHCNAHTDQEPVWKISAETFETTLAIYRRDVEAFDRGLKAG